MDLEQRIKKLEDELKILKNQIQTTLLEIQSEVMSHYYPYLRADEEGQQEGREKPLIAPLPDPTPPLEVLLDEEEEEVAELSPVKVQKVSLGEVRQHGAPRGPSAQKVAGVARGNPTGQAAARAAPTTDLTILARVSKWASSSVARIGREHTTQLLERCVQDGYLAPQMLQSLAFVISLGGSEEPAKEDVPVEEVLNALVELTEVLTAEA